MADNVLLLGAGFSHAAGIPLMSTFIERMWEIASRNSYNGTLLSSEDTAIFSKAMSVRLELDGFHGRAAFDDRNIEDILSMLSFSLLSGDRRGSRRIEGRWGLVLQSSTSF
jgi:hypothetical protein